MSKRSPLIISVIVPCFNRADFLRPTLDSILNQNYPHIECIVMDAESTDGTVEILKSYGEQIRWVSEPDNGPADAINKGWAMSAGEIVTWLNADDVWAGPDSVSQAVQYFQEHPEVDVVYGDCGAIDVNGKQIGMAYLHEWDLKYAIENCDHCIPQPAAFIRRRAIEQVGGLDTQFILMDRDLWYRIGLIGNIKHIPVLLAHARRHPSYWHTKNHIVAANCVAIIKKFFATSRNIPVELRRLKRRAISNAYLRGIEYYVCYGPVQLYRVLSLYFNAILADPSNMHRILASFKTYVENQASSNVLLWWILVFLNGLLFPLRAWRQVRPLLNLKPSITPNLLGDRDIEWSWVASQMPAGPGEALDFGTGGSFLSLIAAQKNFFVTAVDLGAVQWHYQHSQIRFLQGDILNIALPANHFDLVINCSTVEHVGLTGRYGVVKKLVDGDLQAMQRLYDLMKPDRTMLLTIPVGRDAVFPPMCRVYGHQRLPRLLEGYVVEKEAYWIKDEENRWICTDKTTALNFEASAGAWDPLRNITALGCFVLKK